MREYGIDGVFMQRFACEIRRVRGLRQFTTVLANAREGANRNGRAYAVMYDLSGLRRGQVAGVLDDWKNLVGRMKITADPAYLHHRGKPVLGVWGLGFNDGRKYTLDEGIDLVRRLKADPAVGPVTVVLGVPAYWRTLNRDSLADTKVHQLCRLADVISPWNVGRYATPRQVERQAKDVWTPDLAWCRKHKLDYMPVAFPGFSWHNLKSSSPLNQIPRLGGRLLWSQYAQARAAGATMIYTAMFDEVDEGTAIFKCTNNPPVGASRFVTYEGLASDHYLKLVGAGTKMLRGEIPPTETLPELGPTFAPAEKSR